MHYVGRSLFGAAAFVFLVGCDVEDFDGGERSQTDFHYSYPMAKGGNLDVETFNGSIEIVGWDQDAVDINGTKYARNPQLRDEIKIDTTHTGNSVTVHAVRPFENHGNMGARFVIHVPKKMALGRIATSNGKIEIRSISGSANLRTSNGHISAEQFDGAIDASTSNGRITVQDALSAGRAPIHARTSNGSIEIDAQGAALSDLHASTSNGSITVRLPSSLPARVRATTSNSSIESDFDVTMQGRIDKHHLEGAINGSSADAPVIELNTSNGHIRIAKI